MWKIKNCGFYFAVLQKSDQNLSDYYQFLLKKDLKLVKTDYFLV